MLPLELIVFFGAMSRSPLEDDVYNDPETRKDNALIQRRGGRGGRGSSPLKNHKNIGFLWCIYFSAYSFC